MILFIPVSVSVEVFLWVNPPFRDSDDYLKDSNLGPAIAYPD
jgi:hypothetical protein